MTLASVTGTNVTPRTLCFTQSAFISAVSAIDLAVAPNVSASGLEPINLTLERIGGIEPPWSAWKAEVLPLNYIRIFGTR